MDSLNYSTPNTQNSTQNSIQNKNQSNIFNIVVNTAVFTLGATFAYRHPRQLKGFVAGFFCGISLTHLAKYIFKGSQPSVSETTSRQSVSSLEEPSKLCFNELKESNVLKNSCIQLINGGLPLKEGGKSKRLPLANYCFVGWGQTRKEIDIQAILNSFESENGSEFNSSLPLFLIVLRDSTNDEVEAVQYEFMPEGLTGIAFFNSNNGLIIQGSGYEDNRKKIKDYFHQFQEAKKSDPGAKL